LRLSLWRRLVWLLLIVGFFSLLFFLFRKTCVIRFTNRTRGQTFFSREVSPGDRFTLKYVHSVQKTPVYEIYSIDERGAVVLQETRVKSLGYGLPAPTPKDHYLLEREFLVIRDMNRRIGTLLIRISFHQPMELSFGERMFDLQQCGQAGDLIEVRALCVRRISSIIGGRGKGP
jgi:hypothetical protein